MKKIFALCCAVLGLCFGITSCSSPSSSDDEKTPVTPENPTNPENPAEEKKESGLSVQLSESKFSAWESGSASFKDNVLTLNTNTTKNDKPGNGATISFETVNASAYKYAKFSYENLDLPNVNFRLCYSDDTYSEVYLQTNENAVYIELDAERKSNITHINFLTRENAHFIGAEKCSLTVKSLSFVNEKPVSQKTPITDKKDGTFDDSVTALELSDKIALGYSLGSGLNQCPFYDDEKTKEAGFGFQNNYKDDAANNKWQIPLKMNLSDQETALGNQTGGMAFEFREAPLITKEFLHAIKQKGFSSIRICVTWFPHIIDKNYTINPDFMARVKQVVDWSLEEGFYVLLNEHHSIHAYCPNPSYACGYNITEEAKEESEKYLKAIYEQICAAFNGSYDERLIFETLNEPRVIGQNKSDDKWAPRGGWGNEECMDDTDLEEPTKIINEYNKLILDTIRASGGNNAKRFVMVPTYATDWSTVKSEYFELPEDSASGKLMVAIHWYPLGFNTNEKQRDSYTDTTRKEVLKNKFNTVFKATYERFVSKGVPVCITEFGIENDDNLGTYEKRKKYFSSAEVDREERKECLSDFCEAAGKYGLSAMAWDDGCIHSVVKRLSPYASYDGDDFINALISSWQKGRVNPYTPSAGETKTLAQIFESRVNAVSLTLTGDTELSEKNWNKACEISASELSSLSETSILKLELSKISGSAYSQIRICPKDSWVSLEMSAENFFSESGASNLSNAINDGKDEGKNINFESETDTIYYKLSSADCTKIAESCGIVIHGYGVLIQSVSLSN